MMQNKIKSEPSKAVYCSSLLKCDCVKIKVVGIINTCSFQRARICAEKLYQHIPFKFAQPQIIELFQLDWHEYIEKMKRRIGGSMWLLTRTVAVFINNEFIGSDKDLIHYISQDYVFSLPFEIKYYENVAAERCKRFMEKSKRIYVYFTLHVNNHVIGSFVFMLYSDLLPLTCQHFLNLCNGYDEAKQCYRDAYYINTRVHRIVKNGWLQCGDVEQTEISEEKAGRVMTIPDEYYCIPHDRRGVLSMANEGKHYNQSQFVVCLKPNPWMNHYYVAFGQLIDGAKTLNVLENIPTYYEQPIQQIVIAHCGEFSIGDESKMETESQIFLEHHSIADSEGEATRSRDNIFDRYSIKPWLDNVVDVIDVRDTASLLMAEKYFNGLYCLSTNYEPGMDTQVTYPAKSESTTDQLRQLLVHFHPDEMSECEKILFISQISEIILAHIFYYESNEYCLKHISMHSHVTIHRILEIAYEIARQVIESAEKKCLISRDCDTINIPKMFEKCIQDVLPSENCMLFMQQILNKAILCLITTIDKTEKLEE